LVKVIVKHDNLELLKWIENHCEEYSFNLEYLAKAIESDSGKCIVYFYEENQIEVDKNPGLILKAI